MDGTVLIADDDRTIRTVLTQALTRAGCRVHATGSLAQLLRWVEEGRGDLVITDVMMPDGNGIDRIPAIREVRPDLPVIVISAQNTIVTAIRATEAAAFDYLPKPFDLPDLMSKANQALSRRPRKSDPIPEALAPRLTDRVMEAVAPGWQRSGGPLRRRTDNLYGPAGHDGDERAGRHSLVRERSYYTTAVMHPVATAALVAGVAALGALMVGGGRQIRHRDMGYD